MKRAMRTMGSPNEEIPVEIAFPVSSSIKKFLKTLSSPFISLFLFFLYLSSSFESNNDPEVVSNPSSAQTFFW